MDYILVTFAGKPAEAQYFPHLVMRIRDLVWRHQMIPFDVFLYDLTRPTHTSPEETALALKLLKALLVGIVDPSGAGVPLPKDETITTYEHIRASFVACKDAASNAAPAWGTAEFIAKLQKLFCEGRNFEQLGGTNSIPVPTYYGYVWNRMVPALHRTVEYLLELKPAGVEVAQSIVTERLALLEAVVLHFAPLYHTHGNRLADLSTLLKVHARGIADDPTITTLLFKFFASPADIASRFSDTFQSYLNGAAVRDLLPEGALPGYLRARMFDVQRAIDEGSPASHNAHGGSHALAVAEAAALELLALPISSTTLVDTFLDTAINSPALRSFNGTAHIMLLLPAQNVSDGIARKLRQILTNDAVNNSGAAAAGRSGGSAGGARSKAALFCSCIHAVWLHSHVQRSHAGPLLHEVFAETTFKSVEQIAFLCRVLGPFASQIRSHELLFGIVTEATRALEAVSRIGGGVSAQTKRRSAHDGRDVVIYLQHLLTANTTDAADALRTALLAVWDTLPR